VTKAPRMASRLGSPDAVGYAALLTDPSSLSRAAVIGVTSHADKSRHGSQTPRGLTADPAHNRLRSAGSGAARLADLPALSPSTPGDLTGTLAPLSSLTPGRAHAPGLSPTPSRLTPSALGARPLSGPPSGREAASLPVAEAQASDAARIAVPCSAPATPEAAGESATRSDAPHPATASGTTAHSPSLHHPQLHPAVSAHDVSQRAQLASAGSSDARTQGGSRSSATRTDRGQSSAPIRRRQECARANGVGTEAPAGSPAPVDLIDQSTRPRGGSPRPSSTRPAGPTPAGTSTQGEN
jgi:hypothetical protein